MTPRTPKPKKPSPTVADAQNDRGARRLTRRSLLGAGAGAAAAIVSAPGSAQEGDNLPPSVPEWQLEPGAETLSQPYGRPSKFEADVVRRYRQGLPEPPTRLSSFSLTPASGPHGIITPNGLHYERHHAGVPTIDPAEHRLMVHGLVERPLIFTMDDLTRFPSVSRDPLPRMFGQHPELGRAKARTDGPGHARAAELLRMDRRSRSRPCLRKPASSRKRNGCWPRAPTRRR